MLHNQFYDMKQIICILIGILYIGCQYLPKNVIIVNTFPSSQHIKGNEMQTFDNELGIISLQSTDRFYICGSHKTDYHFSIYSKENMAKVTDLCKRGRGPNEFIAPAFYSQYETENNQIKIWVLDRATSQLAKINLDQSIEKGETHIEKSFSLLDYTRFSLREVFLLNDTLLFGTEDYKACKHMLLNLKDSSINYIPQTINFSESYDPFPISQTISTYSPDKKYIASAYFNFPRIDFIDDKGEIFKIIFYKEYINPLSVNLSQESEEYFSAICSDQKYIYALYNRENIEQNEIKTNSSIFVFTWNGEPIKECIIPYATYINIDKQTQTLLAIDINKEKNIVTSYLLNDLLKIDHSKQ